jgi:hypothetical protein
MNQAHRWVLLQLTINEHTLQPILISKGGNPTSGKHLLRGYQPSRPLTATANRHRLQTAQPAAGSLATLEAVGAGARAEAAMPARRLGQAEESLTM